MSVRRVIGVGPSRSERYPAIFPTSLRSWRYPLHTHVAEAFVQAPHAECVADKICARFSAYCQSTGTDRILDFGDARAILKPTDEGLHFRVEAEELVTFYGIRTLLQASLSTITVPGGAVEWHPACSVSFEAIREHVESGQVWPGGK
ncbi:SMa0974 family conjugal transfer regulator [Rhizobium sp. PDO1-076]